MKRIVYAVMALGAASITHAASLTPDQQAFADAQALAASAQANAVSNLSSGGVSSTINQFNPTYYNSKGTAPESSLFQNGNGNTVSAGQTKIADCQNGTPNPDPFLRQNCEAINLMANNPSKRPQFSIPPRLFDKSKAIVANANTLATSSLGISDPNAVGAFSGCVNKTVGPAPTTKICSEFKGTAAQQCTVGQVVVVDEFTNYKCDKTVDIYLPQTCDKTVNVVVTQPAPVSAVVTQTLVQAGTFSFSSTGFGSRATLYYTCRTTGVVTKADGDYPCVYMSQTDGSVLSCLGGTSDYFCPNIYNTVYSCPAGTTLTGSGTNSTCIYPAVVTSSVNNGCAVQEAAAL